VTGLHDEANDATPLNAEERDGLIPSHIALRSELNELERQNIIEADLWAFARRRNPVSERFARDLHRRMFRKVWRWAGKNRTSDKNIGVTRSLINARIDDAIDNIQFWIDHKTFPPDEIAVRFHHTLVFIHPFPNGNGRWSRLMADILAVQLGRPRFTWGRVDLHNENETRKAYMAALTKADNHDFTALIAFARS
jgi:Fic-DOC domain mobile mystery protein B